MPRDLLEERQPEDLLGGMIGPPTPAGRGGEVVSTLGRVGRSAINKTAQNVLQANKFLGQFKGVRISPAVDRLVGEATSGLLQRRQELRKETPIATGAGEFLGDALTLALTRYPVSQFATRGRISFLRNSELGEIPPGGVRLLKRWFTGSRARTLAERLGRVAETGAEAAFIAALNDQDPVEAAAFGAGSQAIGSVFTGGVSSIKGGLTLAGAAAGLTALIQLAKSGIPGGSDSLISSGESAFNKLLWGVGLGILAGGAGLGRLTGKSAEDLPRLADAATSIPRGVFLSVLNEVTQGNTDIEPVLGALSSNPTVFRPDTQVKLRKALTDEGGDLGFTIDRLKATDPHFKRRLDKLKESENK